MKGEVVAIIPARYASTRLPGKSLLSLGGIPMVVRVARQAASARLVSRVIIATDSKQIASAATDHGVEALMTSETAASGTDRVAEAAAFLNADRGLEIIVNVQGDEPLIDPATIDAAIAPLLDDPRIPMSTTSEPIGNLDDVFNPNVVKVVTDSREMALYFSRSPVPYIRPKEGHSLRTWLEEHPELLSHYRKHSGLYCYRAAFLKLFAATPPSPLEQLESLEQLRAIENGHQIRVVRVEHRSIGVDTPQDYELVKELILEEIS